MAPLEHGAIDNEHHSLHAGSTRSGCGITGTCRGAWSIRGAWTVRGTRTVGNTRPIRSARSKRLTGSIGVNWTVRDVALAGSTSSRRRRLAAVACNAAEST